MDHQVNRDLMHNHHLFGSLESRYESLCKVYGVEPQSQILESCKFASRYGGLSSPPVLNFPLREVRHQDVAPLMVLLTLSTSDVSAIDVDGEETELSSIVVLQILQAARDKLRNVDLSNKHIARDVLKQMLVQGLPCHSLTLSGCHMKKLSCTGIFSNLQALFLDHNVNISAISERCFCNAPNLSKLSLAGSSVSNLWTTAAALSKLGFLKELRFQQCHCCLRTTASCPEKSPAGRKSKSPSYSRVFSPHVQRLVDAGEGSGELVSGNTQGLREMISGSPTHFRGFPEADFEPSAHNAETAEQQNDAENPIFFDMEGFGEEQDMEADFPPTFFPTRGLDSHPGLGFGGESSRRSGPTFLEEAERGPGSSNAPAPGLPEDSYLNMHSGSSGLFWNVQSGEGSGSGEQLVFGSPVEERTSAESGEFEGVWGAEAESSGAMAAQAQRDRVNFGNEGRRAGNGGNAGENEENLDEPPPSPSENREGAMEEEAGVQGLVGSMFYRSSSPICEENHYRAFFVTVLPNLTVLDNLKISEGERRASAQSFRENFEPLPNNRSCRESVSCLLQQREVGGPAFGRNLLLRQRRRAGNGGEEEEFVSAEKEASRKAVWSSKGGDGGFTARCLGQKSLNFRTESALGFRRTLESVRVGSSFWPEISPIRMFNSPGVDIHRRFRPRQFEYSPLDPQAMVLGTLQGEVVVLNHESGSIVGHIHSAGAPHSILGLCWLNRDASKLIGGCDNGSIQLYDVNHMRARHVASLAHATSPPPQPLTPGPPSPNPNLSPNLNPSPNPNPALVTYDDFEQLTSVHINCTDDLFVASGYSTGVALYDLPTGRSLQTLPRLHSEHINVAKFAHSCPHLLATSSFDRTVKLWDLRQGVRSGPQGGGPSPPRPVREAVSDKPNVMVCFSPDDRFLLTSAVDNEVRQYLTSDGRLHLKLNLRSNGSQHNYTRSYYMNGGDYIITGSCEENTVKICCSQTGRMLRDVAFEPHNLHNRANRTSPYVQSLRGDPWKSFHFSVLIVFHHPTPRSEIVKVNLMSSQAQRHGERGTRAMPPAGLGA